MHKEVISAGLAALRTAACGCIMLAGLMLGQGCSTVPDKGPLTVVRDVRESAAKRVMAVEILRETQSAGKRVEGGLIAPRDVYKEIAWTLSQPPKLRAAVVDSMLNDSDPAVVEDGKELAKLLLPKEATREVVVAICKNAAMKGWKDFTPAIVRAYSRTLPGVDESDRVERAALQDLHPGKTVDEVVFGVFVEPPVVPPTERIDWTMRYRADAWNVLARIDETGATRGEMLRSASSGSEEDSVINAIRACQQDLRCLPITGEELTWLSSLRNPARKDNASWWREATEAVAMVPTAFTGPASPLMLRHAEPIRWAMVHRREYLTLDRAALLELLSARMKSRKFIPRTVIEGKKGTAVTKSELLAKREGELSWGDVLTILVIDEAIREPQVVSTLFAQAQADRADRTTEYGGLLAWNRRGASASRQAAGDASTQGQSPERAVIMLYMPRSAQRLGDLKFIASDEMVSASDLALAHYHFHVQIEKNAEYAGPSKGDLEYAQRMGRSCVVVTSIREGVMALDYYQPSLDWKNGLGEGTTIDLGELSK